MAEEMYSVIFNTINIYGIETNSGVFVGENYQPMWSSHSKNNSCISYTTGHNIINQPINYIYDKDSVDQVIITEEKKWP